MVFGDPLATSDVIAPDPHACGLSHALFIFRMHCSLTYRFARVRAPRGVALVFSCHRSSFAYIHGCCLLHRFFHVSDRFVRSFPASRAAVSCLCLFPRPVSEPPWWLQLFPIPASRVFQYQYQYYLDKLELRPIANGT